MVWLSHNMVTFTTLYVATNDLSAAIAGMLGSTLPDKIEGPFWRLWHRKWSHWFATYLPVLFIFAPYQGNVFPAKAWVSSGFGSFLQCFVFWFFIGALLHILEDAICGAIPVWSPNKKIKVFPRLFYVGSMKEYLFVGAYCICMGMITFIKV